MYLFEAGLHDGKEWCAPCAKLKSEMQAAGIRSAWPLRLSTDCQVTIPLVHVVVNSSYSESIGPTPLYRRTDSLPEHALVLNGELIGNDNYSDRTSVEAWLRRKLETIVPEYPDLCDHNGPDQNGK